MDFDPSEEQRITLDAFRRFVEAEIAPAVQPWRDATIPKDEVQRSRETAETKVPKLASFRHSLACKSST
jgi:hypothetical protein